MPRLVLLGATGFVGRACLDHWDSPAPIIAVARRVPPDGGGMPPTARWQRADLLVARDLEMLFDRDDIVVNLVYIPGDVAANLHLIDTLGQACVRSGVRRLVHCSTAVVAGATRQRRVTEATPCLPQTGYERTKLQVEARARRWTSQGVDVGILRPTAIVGPGSQNLRTLAHALKSGSALVNYCRASLFGTRHMHLVPVRNVASALLHLASLAEPLGGRAFIVSSDEDPENNFASVEAMLAAALGLPTRMFPPCSGASVALPVLLKLAGRSSTQVDRVYDSARLLGTGFTPPESVRQAVQSFGEALLRDAGSGHAS